MQPSIDATPLRVVLAELKDLVVRMVAAVVEVAEESPEAVVGKKGGPNSVVTVGRELSGTVVTITLTTDKPVGPGLDLAANGSGGPHIPGGGVSHPESWMLVGVTVTLNAVVVKVPTMTPLETS